MSAPEWIGYLAAGVGGGMGASVVARLTGAGRVVRVTRIEGPRPLELDDLRPGRELVVEPSGRSWVVVRVERSTGRGDGDSIRLDLIPNPNPRRSPDSWQAKRSSP